MNSTAAIFARLSGSTSVVSRLDAYRSEPAIFNDRAPDAFQFAEKAAVIIAAPTNDRDASTFTESIRAITQDVRIYTRDVGSSAVLDTLARDIRDLFHLQPEALVITGGKANIVTVSGPVSAPTTDPAIVGRRLIISLELQKS